MRAARAIVVFLIVGAAVSSAEAPGSPTVPVTLLSHSAFLRGYFAGYQQGFHQGDLDLQLGRNGDPDYYQGQDISFPSGLGNRNAYGKGFRKGFRVAYADAYEGRSFRAVDALRQVGARLPVPESAVALRATEAGLMDGYGSGLSK